MKNFICFLSSLLTINFIFAESEWLYYGEYPWVWEHKNSDWLYLMGGEDGKIFAYRNSSRKWEEFGNNESIEDSEEDSLLIFEANNPPNTVTAKLSTTSNLDMIWVPPGTLSLEETGIDVEPEKDLSVNKGFYLGKYEFTQAQYETVMTGNNDGLSASPSYWANHPNRPVENVSYEDVQKLLTRLNIQQSQNLPSGWSFRLPSEIQWEYACRAGSKSLYSWGDSITKNDANYQESGYSQTQDVGNYAANNWGFFDMHGNVSEWCSDASSWGNTTYITEKGGSWQSPPENLRSSAMLAPNPSTDRININGFRISLQQVD